MTLVKRPEKGISLWYNQVNAVMIRRWNAGGSNGPNICLQWREVGFFDWNVLFCFHLPCIEKKTTPYPVEFWKHHVSSKIWWQFWVVCTVIQRRELIVFIIVMDSKYVMLAITLGVFKRSRFLLVLPRKFCRAYDTSFDHWKQAWILLEWER